MAINLITGLPGASKTLNLLRMVDQECKGRTVYQYGVTDCKMPWTELTLDQLHTWWELPIGSVIVVDEAQDVWPATMSRKEPVPSVARMATHRKGGYDFYLVTQRPTMVCSYLRGFVGPHFHYERIFARPGAKEVRFEKCQTDTEKTAVRKKAQIHYRPFTKKYFDQYKSAELHTYKPKIPRVAYLLAGALVFSAFMGYRVLSGFVAEPEPQQALSDNHSDTFSAFTPSPGPSSSELTPQQYAAQFVPRIPDVPHSAPVYDKLTNVQSFPRPQCILRVRNNVCRCYTQQATPLDISHDVCVDIVENGVFNPFQPDQPETAGAQAAPAAAPAVSHLVNDDSRPRITRIADNPVITRREINLQPRSDRKTGSASF